MGWSNEGSTLTELAEHMFSIKSLMATIQISIQNEELINTHYLPSPRRNSFRGKTMALCEKGDDIASLSKEYSIKDLTSCAKNNLKKMRSLPSVQTALKGWSIFHKNCVSKERNPSCLNNLRKPFNRMRITSLQVKQLPCAMHTTKSNVTVLYR